MPIGAALGAVSALSGAGGGGGDAPAGPISQGPVTSGAGAVGGGWTLNVVPRTKTAEVAGMRTLIVFSGVVLGLGYFAIRGKL